MKINEVTKKIEPSKPRNFVAKNATTSGAGQHKDKAKTIPRKEKHKGKSLDMNEHGVAEGTVTFDPMKGIHALFALERQYKSGNMGSYQELMQKLHDHAAWTNVVGHNLTKLVPGFTVDDFWTLDDIVQDLSDGYGLPEWFRIINDGGWEDLIEKYKHYMSQRHGQTMNEQGVAEGKDTVTGISGSSDSNMRGWKIRWGEARHGIMNKKIYTGTVNNDNVYPGDVEQGPWTKYQQHIPKWNYSINFTPINTNDPDVENRMQGVDGAFVKVEVFDPNWNKWVQLGTESNLGESGEPMKVKSISGNDVTLDQNGQEIKTTTDALTPGQQPNTFSMKPTDPSKIQPGAQVTSSSGSMSEEDEDEVLPVAPDSTESGIHAETDPDLMGSGINHDVGGDATDRFIVQVKDKGFERAQRGGREGLAGRSKRMAEDAELNKMLTIAGLR